MKNVRENYSTIKQSEVMCWVHNNYVLISCILYWSKHWMSLKYYTLACYNEAIMSRLLSAADIPRAPSYISSKSQY